MLIHEFQAKDLLKELGVAVPAGYVTETADEVRLAAEKLGGQVVLKAQILSGGRGKAGGIVLANSSAQAALAATRLLGRKLITAQSGGRGLVVKKLLVEELVLPAREIYLSLCLIEKMKN
ncbi:MAG: acetate--CoA ligase family protein [Methanosarcina sp.]|nr:acetate--CoA ligase family protein [Methanosarcina sp.]